MQLIDQIMYLFGNMTGSSPQLRQRIIEQYNIIDVIIRILRSSQKLSIEFAHNHAWIASNIS